MTPVALIDADVFAYSCGFATQKTLPGVFEDGGFVEAEPVQNALHLCRISLDNLTRIADSMGYPDIRVFLTGPGNFRFDVAKTVPYKGNRTQPKPVHYEAIREYMVKKWDAEVVEGWEADDAVTAESWNLDHDPAKVCIMSRDKDLLTVPGRLYNPSTGKTLDITEQEAMITEARQILVGDVVDNIPGCYKVGEVRAGKLITPGLTRPQIADRLVEEFAQSTKKKGCLYADRNPVDVVNEMGQLVHLRRWRNDTWTITDRTGAAAGTFRPSGNVRRAKEKGTR